MSAPIPTRSSESTPDQPRPRSPEALGLTRSFGFGDRIGLATPGHLAAIRRFSIAPVLAQVAPREAARSAAAGSARAAIDAAAQATVAARFTRPWGADANGIKTEADIEQAAATGFTWFTLDPSAFIENRADTLSANALAEELAILGKEGVLPASWIADQAGRRFEFSDTVSLAPDLDSLGRAAVKFARSLQYAQRLARHLSGQAVQAPFDLELALVECATPATPEEHLFVALEARRRGLSLTALALRWDAGIEPGAEFAGDAGVFEQRLRVHAAIARHCGPYKLSVHHGGDKLALLPAIGRTCGDHLHVKTAGTTFLAALRLVCRTAPDLFREIVAFARQRFDNERIPHLVSTTRSDVARLFRGLLQGDLEPTFLDTRSGRQLLDTTAGSILHSGVTSRGRPFRDAIIEILLLRRDDHHALLDSLFTRHLALLNEG